MFGDADDSCVLAWSAAFDGPVVGCWDGTVKLFAEHLKDPLASWNDPDFPDDPVRGLVVAPNDAVVVCNDFQLSFLAPDLSVAVKTIPAKEKDTCRLTSIDFQWSNQQRLMIGNVSTLAFWWDFPQGFSIIDLENMTKIHNIAETIPSLNFRNI